MAEGTDTNEPMGAPGTIAGANEPRRLDFDPRQVAEHLPPTTDQRTLTRRARNKATKERLRRQRDTRINNENLIIAAIDSGATHAALSQETGLSTTQIGRIYKRAMTRAGTSDIAEFKAMQAHRLGSLLMATWTDAQENDPPSVRNALRLIQEMNRMEPGAYPAAGIDLTGTLTTNDVSVDRLAMALASLAAQRNRRLDLAVEAEAVDELPVLTAKAISVRSNGHAADTSILDAP